MLLSLLPNNKILWLLICLQLLVPGTAAQVGPARTAEQEDVVRVYTELIQTDFMVFDKKGRFVEGLKREDFELYVDGKLEPIRFFDQVRAGTKNEEAQLAAARGAAASPDNSRPTPLDRGRPVFFFIDDLHLTPDGLGQTSTLLRRFINSDLKQDDMAQIVTASGRLGILQQLTDNKAVLRKAVERLIARGEAFRDFQRPPMSEFEALQIDRGDRDALGYFVDELLAQNRMMSRQSAEDEVRRRASMILEYAANSTKATLSSFEAFIRQCAKLPGRKLMFLISEGFFMDSRRSDTSDRIRAIISAAGHSGVVIYSIDARGLIATLMDASSDRAVDRSGRLQRARAGEIGQSQDVLNVLARDTGGRPFFDRNDLHAAVENGLKETSRYYVAVWRPAGETNGSTNKFRQLVVKVVGKPDLIVRFRRGFFDLPVSPARKSNPGRDAKTPQPTVEAKLREAIVAPHENREIPIALSLNYLDEPGKGIVLSVSMQIPADSITLESEGDRIPKFDVAGVVYDDQGKLIGSFRQRLPMSATNAVTSLHELDFAYSHKMLLQPGLYQVRVAALEIKSGNVGNTNAWVEIPNLAKGDFALSTLLLGERAKSDVKAPDPLAAMPDSVNLKIDRHFRRDSFLRYVIFIYNARRSASGSKPDIVVQIQILRNDQPVATTPLKQVIMDGAADAQRIPYAAELPLDDFPPGKYVLQFTAIDRVAKRTAIQRIRFEIQ